MATLLKNGQQVRVILKALADGVYPPERTLTLETSNPVIPIGRASKSASKGLLAAVDNAWFDSPVMSREHAEILLGEGNESVMIRDLRSMHGTRLNQAELRPNVPTRVESGDHITFGAEVRRGNDVYPACSFQVNYDVESSSPSMSTIKFPEGSDVEEEDDYLSEEYDFNEEDENTPAESSPFQHPTLAKKHVAIDLTADSDHGSTGSQVSSDSPIVTRIRSLKDWNAKDTYPDSYESFGGEDYPSDLEEVFQDGQAHRAENQKFHNNGYTICDVDDDCSEEYREEDYICEAPDSYEVDDNRGHETFSEHGSNSGEKKDLVHSNEHIPVSDLRSSLVASDIPGVPAVNQPSAPWDDDEAYSEPSKDFIADEARTAIDTSISTMAQIENSKYNLGFAWDGMEEGSLLATAGHPLDAQASKAEGDADLASGLSYAPRAERQPSPSDAAMVKNDAALLMRLKLLASQSSAPQRQTTSNSVDVHQLPIAAWREQAAKTLGERTGKVEYFSAREENRRQQNCEALPFGYRNVTDSESSLESSLVASGQHASFRSGNASLSTSAVSTPPITGLAKEGAHAVPNRSSVKIDDIVEHPISASESIINQSLKGTAPEEPVKQSVKRKSDAISDVREEELQAWARSSAKDPISLPVVSVLPEERSKSSSVTLPSTSEPRATKRLKKIAEAVGYAALGGVAAGATLFSVLVATAPEFV